MAKKFRKKKLKFLTYCSMSYKFDAQCV